MEHRVVYQHHPEDLHYSLEDVDPDPSAFHDTLADPDKDVKAIGYPLPKGEVYVLYTPGVSGTADDLDHEFDPDQLEERLDPMDTPSQVVSIWLLKFFADMQEEEQENGEDLAIYKDLALLKPLLTNMTGE